MFELNAVEVLFWLVLGWGLSLAWAIAFLYYKNPKKEAVKLRVVVKKGERPVRVWHFYNMKHYFTGRKQNCPSCGKYMSGMVFKVYFLLHGHNVFKRRLLFCSEKCIPKSIVTGGYRKSAQMVTKEMEEF